MCRLAFIRSFPQPTLHHLGQTPERVSENRRIYIHFQFDTSEKYPNESRGPEDGLLHPPRATFYFAQLRQRG